MVARHDHTRTGGWCTEVYWEYTEHHMVARHDHTRTGVRFTRVLHYKTEFGYYHSK